MLNVGMVIKFCIPWPTLMEEPALRFYFYRMNSFEEKKDAFGRLLTIMDELRAKCPWDKKQTLESLRHLTIAEV